MVFTQSIEPLNKNCTAFLSRFFVTKRLALSGVTLKRVISSTASKGQCINVHIWVHN